MKCDACDKPATVQEAVRVGKTFVFKNLCEACAASSGILESQPQMPVGLGQKPIAKPAAKVVATEPACPSCGMTIRSFRSTKRLGCGECYTAFEKVLAPLIAREHEGATHHGGKVPARLTTAVEPERGETDPRQAIERSLEVVRRRGLRLRELKALLGTALTAEQYERAAEIKRAIERLESGGDPEAPPERPGDD